MSECAICDHAKVGAIDAALSDGLALGVIAARYHVAKKLIELHQTHRTSAMQAMPIITIDRDVGEALLASGARVPTRPISIDEMCGHTPRVVLKEMQAFSAPQKTEDALRLFRQHVDEAARIWWDEVEDHRRSPERLQLILAEAFADPNLGLP